MPQGVALLPHWSLADMASVVFQWMRDVLQISTIKNVPDDLFSMRLFLLIQRYACSFGVIDFDLANCGDGLDEPCGRKSSACLRLVTARMEAGRNVDGRYFRTQNFDSPVRTGKIENEHGS